jgi:hypothetical protein
MCRLEHKDNFKYFSTRVNSVCYHPDSYTLHIHTQTLQYYLLHEKKCSYVCMYATFSECTWFCGTFLLAGYVSKTQDSSSVRTARKIPFMYCFLGIARPQSQFPHSCVCEQFLNIARIGPLHIFPAAEYKADRWWEYINRSQTHECGNWDCGRAIPFLGIFVSNFWYWFFAVRVSGSQYYIFVVSKWLILFLFLGHQGHLSIRPSGLFEKTSDTH